MITHPRALVCKTEANNIIADWDKRTGPEADKFRSDLEKTRITLKHAVDQGIPVERAVHEMNELAFVFGLATNSDSFAKYARTLTMLVAIAEYDFDHAAYVELSSDGKETWDYDKWDSAPRKEATP